MKARFIILFLFSIILMHAQTVTLCGSPGFGAFLAIGNQQNLSNPAYSIQPGGQTSPSGQFVVFPAFNTTYTLYVTGQNSQQVTVTNSTIITVLVASKVTFTTESQNGSNMITCTQSSISMISTSNYTFGTLSYSWTGPAFTSTLANTILTKPGTYTITAIDPATTCSATATIFVGINTLTPTSSLSSTLQTASCTSAPTSVTLTATNPSSNFLHKVFDPAGGLFTGSSKTVSYLPGMAGTYTYVLEDLSNGCVISKQFTLTSSTLPTFSLQSAPANYSLGCATKSVCFANVTNVQFPLGGMATFTLLPPGASTNLPAGNLGTQNTYSINVPGTWTIVIRDSQGGCELHHSFSITQNTIAPILDVLSIPYNVLNCSHHQTSINAKSYNSNVTYSWTMAGSTTTYTTSSIVASLQPGAPTQTVAGSYTLTMLDKNNFCKSSTSIKILQNLYTPMAKIGATTTVLTCKNQTIQLFNNSSTGIPPGVFPTNSLVVSSEWKAPSQPTATFQSSYLIYTPGQASVTILDLNNGCETSTVITISDNRDMPPVSGSPFAVDLCNVPSVQISPVITGTPSALTFTWVAPLGAIVVPGTVNSQVLHTSSAGVFTLNVSNPQGCTSVLLFTVGICVGFDDTAEEEFVTIYPNPASNSVHVRLPDNETGEIILYNLTGQILRKQNFEGISALDVTGYSQGIYVISIRSGNKSKNYRLIKE